MINKILSSYAFKIIISLIGVILFIWLMGSLSNNKFVVATVSAFFASGITTFCLGWNSNI